jgi:hypothetical protein
MDAASENLAQNCNNMDVFHSLGSQLTKDFVKDNFPTNIARGRTEDFHIDRAHFTVDEKWFTPFVG